MKKEILFTLVLLFVAFQLASALNSTEIKLKTPPFCEVYLSVLDSSTNEIHLLEKYRNFSNEFGDVVFTYSGNQSTIDLSVLVDKGDENIFFKQYREKYPTGNPIYLEIKPEGYDLVYNTSNTTLSNQTNNTANDALTNNTANFTEANNSLDLTNETSNDSITDSNNFEINAIQNNSFEQETKTNLKKTNYYVIGIFGLIVLFFIINLTIPRKRSIKIVKLSDKLRESYSSN